MKFSSLIYFVCSLAVQSLLFLIFVYSLDYFSRFPIESNSNPSSFSIQLRGENPGPGEESRAATNRKQSSSFSATASIFPEKPAPKTSIGRRKPRKENPSSPKNPVHSENNSMNSGRGLSEKTGAQGGEVNSLGPGEEKGGSILGTIRARIERAKRYPPLAKARQLEGVVQVRFSIGEDGQVQNLKIVSSSGFSILDEEALAAVKRGAPFPSYPHPIQFPLRFKLRKSPEDL